MRERLKKLGKIAVFTVIEAVTLVLGLALVLGGRWYEAIGVFEVGFIAEHLVSFNVKNGRPLLRFEGLPVVGLLVVATLENATWSIWLALAPIQQILAVIVLVLGLAAGHALEINLVNRRPIREAFVRRLTLTLDITGIETVIGIVWRALVLREKAVAAVIVLAGGLFVEHVISAAKRLPK